jgi:hypothetical protein
MFYLLFSLFYLLVRWIYVIVLRGLDVKFTVDVLCFGFFLREAKDPVKGVKVFDVGRFL